MKTRHAQGVPCPHNKGFGIEVIDPTAIGCLACKHILRTQPDVKEVFDQLAVDEKKRLKSLMKHPQQPVKSWRQKKQEAVNRAHIERTTVIDFSKRTAPNCPGCHAKMMLRTNTIESTKFWGCSRYPKCKITKNI